MKKKQQKKLILLSGQFRNFLTLNLQLILLPFKRTGPILPYRRLQICQILRGCQLLHLLVQTHIFQPQLIVFPFQLLNLYHLHVHKRFHRIQLIACILPISCCISVAQTLLSQLLIHFCILLVHLSNLLL